MTRPSRSRRDADAGVEMLHLRQLVRRYDRAGLLGRAALHLLHRAPDPRQRALLRRYALGVEGRIAEDVVDAVNSSQPVWELLVEKGLPEDATGTELDLTAGALVGHAEPDQDTGFDISIRIEDVPAHVAAVRDVLPGDVRPETVNAYRYATLTDRTTGKVEPFVVALHTSPSGLNTVVSSILVEPLFLRYEQEIGMIQPRALLRLEPVVAADLRSIRQTHRALLRA